MKILNNIDMKLHLFDEDEWMQEPDQVQFEYEGYQCEI